MEIKIQKETDRAASCLHHWFYPLLVVLLSPLLPLDVSLQVSHLSFKPTVSKTPRYLF